MMGLFICMGMLFAFFLPMFVIVYTFESGGSLKISQFLYSNFASKKNVITDIFIGKDGKAYVKWRHVNNKAVTFTRDAENFLLTHHVRW